MKRPCPTRWSWRAYHRAWSGHRFEEAGRCLADDLVLEVPVHSYPTKAAFLLAVERTAGMASKVEMLAELGSAKEAMLLYDMSFPFGELRVAEHFTVAKGRITRIRQIHDTAPFRAAQR